MGPDKKELSLNVAKNIAEVIYRRVTEKVYQQVLFFDGKRFKIAPVNGNRVKRYLGIEEMTVVAYYNEPSYDMVLEDVVSELDKRNFSVKQYKIIKRWVGN